MRALTASHSSPVAFSMTPASLFFSITLLIPPPFPLQFETQTLLEKIKSIYLPSQPAPPKIGSTIPTVGQNVSNIPLRNPNVYLRLWDIGGQLTLRKLWKSYYGSAHAIVFVIDSTDIPRIESEVVATLREVVENEETEGVPVLVLANKQDRDESLEIAELKEVVNPVIVQLGARDSRVLPVSALEGYFSSLPPSFYSFHAIYKN
jgi:ADP-ribosylation factor related protein 1